MLSKSTACHAIKSWYPIRTLTSRTDHRFWKIYAWFWSVVLCNENQNLPPYIYVVSTFLFLHFLTSFLWLLTPCRGSSISMTISNPLQQLTVVAPIAILKTLLKIYLIPTCLSSFFPSFKMSSSHRNYSKVPSNFYFIHTISSKPEFFPNQIQESIPSSLRLNLRFASSGNSLWHIPSASIIFLALTYFWKRLLEHEYCNTMIVYLRIKMATEGLGS